MEDYSRRQEEERNQRIGQGRGRGRNRGRLQRGVRSPRRRGNGRGRRPRRVQRGSRPPRRNQRGRSPRRNVRRGRPTRRRGRRGRTSRRNDDDDESPPEIQGVLYDGRYRGGVLDGKPHGKGVYNYKNGDVHSGRYSNGKKHGFGIYTFSSGKRFEGRWENDKKEGRFCYFAGSEEGSNQFIHYYKNNGLTRRFRVVHKKKKKKDEKVDGEETSSDDSDEEMMDQLLFEVDKWDLCKDKEERFEFVFREYDGRPSVRIPVFRLCPFCHKICERRDQACKHTTCTSCHFHFCHICLSANYNTLLFQRDNAEYEDVVEIPICDIRIYRCKGYYHPCKNSDGIVDTKYYRHQTKENQNEWSKREDWKAWKKRRREAFSESSDEFEILSPTTMRRLEDVFGVEEEDSEDSEEEEDVILNNEERYVILKWDLERNYDNELSCRKGEKISVRREEGDWLYCRNQSGEEGYVPKSYVEVEDTTTSTEEEEGDLEFEELNLLGKAAYDFTATDDEEVSIKEGESFRVMKKVRDWVYIEKKDGKDGYVPTSYVVF